ncbi:MAG: sugar phosphate isomerase/epimerase [Oscillospiraceae bacterium]|jgi:sugar phosphate isomerase/epimerase|nr:sugar phosphate isomerase/epimerase [Oscillospiraceae bacterium]
MRVLPPGWKETDQIPEKTRLPLAAQIFPLAEMMDKDLRYTLKMIKEAGYDGVEFFGGLRFTAQDVRYALDDAGLQIAGWHTPWQYLSADNIHSTITYNKVLGNQFLIVPWMPDETLFTKESCLRFAAELTWVSDVLSMFGMVTGYHNHATEFRPTDDTGELPWDIIAQNTPSSVVMQNDNGNGMRGGGDMTALLKKYPGRGVTVHMKPFSSKGDDTFFDDPNCDIDWDEYFKICRNEAGVRWYIVEYLNPVRYKDPLDGLAASAKWFRNRSG